MCSLLKSFALQCVQLQTRHVRLSGRSNPVSPNSAGRRHGSRTHRHPNTTCSFPCSSDPSKHPPGTPQPLPGKKLDRSFLARKILLQSVASTLETQRKNSAVLCRIYLQGSSTSVPVFSQSKCCPSVFGHLVIVLEKHQLTTCRFGCCWWTTRAKTR